jgi:cation transport ATPase
MSFVLDRLESKNSNIENVQKKQSKFVSDELNLDASQCKLMKENYANLKDNTNYELLSNGYQSMNDNMDYVGNLNGNSSKLTNKTKEVNDNMPNKKVDLKIEKKTNKNNTFIKSIDVIISIIYIAVLVFFFIGGLINKEPNNIVNALILTIIYVFYKILSGYIN